MLYCPYCANHSISSILPLHSSHPSEWEADYDRIPASSLSLSQQKCFQADQSLLIELWETFSGDSISQMETCFYFGLGKGQEKWFLPFCLSED